MLKFASLQIEYSQFSLPLLTEECHA